MCQALVDLAFAVNKTDKNPCLMKLSKTYPEKERERAKNIYSIVYILLVLILPSTSPFNCEKIYIQHNKVES